MTVKGPAFGNRASSRGVRQTGLSLLEVILALAILGGSLAVVGELVRLGTRHAAASRDLTTAQLLCESKLNELTAGIHPLQPAGPLPIEHPDFYDEWLYWIDVAPVDGQGLLAVTVMVEQNPAVHGRPVSFSLVHWTLDPELEFFASGEMW